MCKFLLLIIFLTSLNLGVSRSFRHRGTNVDKFQCYDGYYLPIERKCDNIIDCSDDEDGCKYLHDCPPGLFICKSGECKPPQMRCNGNRDCLDGSDEIRCDEAPARIMCNPKEEFECANAYCSPIQIRCDNINDCPYGEDETDCIIKCPFNSFKCQNEKCVPLESRCNGTNECTDKSDEFHCPVTLSNLFGDETTLDSLKLTDFEPK